MSNYYDDVYSKRLNRYGYDYQSRLQSQRERDFENKLLKSVYRVGFEYENEYHAATLERYKQDETQILQYLLTRVSLNLSNGTILMIPDKDGQEQPWMVYWLESIKASGYNKYVVLKMTHFITWHDKEGSIRESWCYLHGSGDSILRDSLKANGAVYNENNNSKFIIMPTSQYLKKEAYFEVGEGALRENYRVIGYDIQTTPGVEYVTIDPVYQYDNTPKPEQTEEDNSDKFYWLNGGRA